MSSFRFFYPQLNFNNLLVAVNKLQAISSQFDSETRKEISIAAEQFQKVEKDPAKYEALQDFFSCIDKLVKLGAQRISYVKIGHQVIYNLNGKDGYRILKSPLGPQVFNTPAHPAVPPGFKPTSLPGPVNTAPVAPQSYSRETNPSGTMGALASTNFMTPEKKVATPLSLNPRVPAWEPASLPGPAYTAPCVPQCYSQETSPSSSMNVLGSTNPTTPEKQVAAPAPFKSDVSNPEPWLLQLLKFPMRSSKVTDSETRECYESAFPAHLFPKFEGFPVKEAPVNSGVRPQTKKSWIY
ncbi:hypothetical protein HYFRA_00011018 [Hymenoscyphus fraxineus]|uniref:Uncharacterized protein n=1 Tax=Hymenoscyphus fraxineus TaxID=746836 RepID=A0A9N9PSR5_9HELO|nr:hypothetical protein HYFRA_00011018 [Hymenoscyphus fraxineus]